MHLTDEDPIMQTIVQNSIKTRLAAGACSLAVLLAGCGGYGGGAGYNGGAAAAPTVSLSVAPTSIVLGQSATLT
ncbi:MAG TPA: hypothetical protein VNH39_05435, partial [Steroidobacteraceae bacterium]|nr:hypothetical protein [Steroidobacteraceae bacterium]